MIFEHLLILNIQSIHFIYLYFFLSHHIIYHIYLFFSLIRCKNTFILYIINQLIHLPLINSQLNMFAKIARQPQNLVGL